jgi:hypothetical protein
VKSSHPVEKVLELGSVSKQFAGCLHEQVRLVPPQHIGCRDLFQLPPKASVPLLREGQVENMELDIRAIPPLAIADKLAYLPFAEAASVFYYIVLPNLHGLE